MKIAYLVNQYPKVSHTFIRREILALERLGFDVQRISIRGWDAPLIDREDQSEHGRTRYVLQDGLASLLFASLGMLASQPGRFFKALLLALKMSRRSERSWPFHLIYLAEACRIVPWLREFGALHLHAHFGTNPAEVAMLVSTLGGPPYSVTVHGSEEWDKPEYLGIFEKVSRSAFMVAVCSHGRSQLFRWGTFVNWHKVHVVHCGLDPAFHSVPVVPIPAAPRLVCVGRLCEQKGQLILLSAVSQLVRKGIAIELVLAGDGEMRAEVEALIVQNRLQAHVHITGWISNDQVRAEILAARALVLPSFAEALPVVIMEALALRRPVLTTYMGGIPELVRPGESGWLLAAGDVDALASAMEEILSTPVAHLEAMGEAGHQRVLERHSVDVEAAKLAQLFRQAQGPASATSFAAY